MRLHSLHQSRLHAVIFIVLAQKSSTLRVVVRISVNSAPRISPASPKRWKKALKVSSPMASKRLVPATLRAMAWSCRV